MAGALKEGPGASPEDPDNRVGAAEKVTDVANGTEVEAADDVELLKAAGLNPEGKKAVDGLVLEVAAGLGFREAAAGANRRAADQLLGPGVADDGFFGASGAVAVAASGLASIAVLAGALDLVVVCTAVDRSGASWPASLLPPPGAMKLVPAKRDMVEQMNVVSRAEERRLADLLDL